MNVDSRSADSAGAPADDGRTAWGRNVAAPVRDFLSTETGGAVVMLAAAVAALAWANAAPHSYASTWTTELGVRMGSANITTDLRHWVNEGLMTLFFLVVGLEAKRELDLGELRERRRIAIPVLAAAGGIAVPVAREPTAGASPCRPTRPLRSAHSRW
jgi:Na+/H+ antiporter NhaA